MFIKIQIISLTEEKGYPHHLVVEQMSIYYTNISTNADGMTHMMVFHAHSTITQYTALNAKCDHRQPVISLTVDRNCHISRRGCRQVAL